MIVNQPPSSLTGALGDYLSYLVGRLRALPTQSLFSGTSPNSVVTGVAGDWAINIGSASTDTRAWIKGGSLTDPDQLNWHPVRIA